MEYNEDMNMKKLIMFFVLLIPTVVMAVNYPTYKPNSRYGQPQEQQMYNSQPTYGGYSTVATGGTTTTGEGSILNTPEISGPRYAAMDLDDDDETTTKSEEDIVPVGEVVLPLLLLAGLMVVAMWRKQQNAKA